MNFNFPVILASNSPRRQQLLADMGIKFEVKVVPVDESYPQNMNVLEVPMYLAKKKAQVVASDEPEALVIGADTVVILDHAILGKPQSTRQATEFLRRLSGQQHQVVTGVCLQYRDNISLFQDTTQVTFITLSPSDIDYYIETCQPLDKAGAYGIQEWIGMVGVSSIEGSYFNVVGLPVHRVYQELNDLKSKI